MRNTIRLTLLILLFNLSAFAQKGKYATISNPELEIYWNLILSLKDSSFVISPLVKESIKPSWIDIPKMVKKYGFIESQLKNSTTNTTLINNNKYFKVISPDSIIKFRRFESTLIIDSKIILDPYYYFIEKTYHKKCICEFSKTIFSKDKTYAITDYTINCGMDDGRGETVLMKKIGLKWIVIDVLGFHGS
ncbi:MAG: hypothetical protein ACM3O8_10340 [Methylococcaceae bacterium]